MARSEAASHGTPDFPCPESTAHSWFLRTPAVFMRSNASSHRISCHPLMAACRIFVGGLIVAAFGRAAEPRLDLHSGDRVVFLGDAFIEGEQYQGWIELMLTSRFATEAVTFRNLGWSGDTPAGDSRLGLSLLQAGREPADEGWKGLVQQLEDARPTVVFVGYGMASSFDGAAGLPKFKTDYGRLLDAIEKTSPGVRFVLLSPLQHENLGAPWPDPAPHNAQLALYAAAVRE